MDEQRTPIFTDEELAKLLDDLRYQAYWFRDVPTKEYRLARRIRDAVENKILNGGNNGPGIAS